MVSHAMGEINGQESTNAYEAFLVNYEKGYRVFEVALILTTPAMFEIVKANIPFFSGNLFTGEIEGA